jgi:predicted RND superfamily exporter protein
LFASLIICSVRVCKSVASVTLLVVMWSWFVALRIVPVMYEVRKKGARTGPTFSSPTVSLSLYPLLHSGHYYSFLPLTVCTVHTLCLFEPHGLRKFCICFDSAFYSFFKFIIGLIVSVSY